MQRTFRGGLIFKAHRLVYHSTLGWRVIKKEKRTAEIGQPSFVHRRARNLEDSKVVHAQGGASREQERCFAQRVPLS